MASRHRRWCEVNAPILALLQLQPAEEAAVPLLHQFAAAHPGVSIVTPHYQDEPWRAGIGKGILPGDGPETSRVVGAEWPSELLAKLEALFNPPPVADEADTG